MELVGGIFFFFFLFLDLEVSLRKPLSELGLA